MYKRYRFRINKHYKEWLLWVSFLVFSVLASAPALMAALLCLRVLTEDSNSYEL
jgi:hypothetical protein